MVQESNLPGPEEPRRVSTALPYRSANHPFIACANRLRFAEPAGWRVAVKPAWIIMIFMLTPASRQQPRRPARRRRVAGASKNGQRGWIRTTDLLLPRQAGTARLPYALMIELMKWGTRQDSNPHDPDS